MTTETEEEALDLEALFATGDAVEKGAILPMPAMPLLEQNIPDTPPMGPPTHETGELPEIDEEIDEIRVGDLVEMPNGKKMKVQWMDPVKKRVGLGKKRGKNYLFFSFHEVKVVKGKKVGAQIQKQRAADAKEMGEPTPAPAAQPGEYMPDLPLNPQTGEPAPYPFQIESIEFAMRPKETTSVSRAPGQAFQRDDKVEVVAGPDKGATGTIFWSGRDKRQPGKMRYGLRSDDKRRFPGPKNDGTIWAGQDDLAPLVHRWNGGLIADEMGLGKTLSAITCLRSPAICVVPALLKHNWGREIARWRPELSYAIIDGGRPELVDPASRKADVVIINYDILHSHADWLSLRNNQTLVADEAHYLKTFQTRFNKQSGVSEIVMGPGKTTRRTRAFYDIRSGLPPEARVILLTGTPILNRTKELYPLLYFIDPVGWGGPYAQLAFWKRYCGGRKGRFGFDASGRTNTEELHQRINNIYMIRHTKAEVLTELPEKRRSTQDVSLTPKYQKTYQKAARNFLEWIKEMGGAKAVARAMRAEVLVQMTKLRRISAIGKVQATTHYIADHFISTQRPLVVMGVHKEAFAGIRKGLDTLNEAYDKAVDKGRSPELPRRIRYGMVLGSTSKKARQQAIDDFQAGKLDVILYAISIATGTTLTRAQDMVFFERLWRPGDQLQAEDRIHRIGQTNHCNIVYLDGVGTIDAKMGMMLIDKTETAAGVIDGIALSPEEASMLVFGEMMGLGGGFLDTLEDLLGDIDEGLLTAIDQSDDEIESVDEAAEVAERMRDDDMEPNPRSRLETLVDDVELVDEDGERIDDFGSVVEDLTANPNEETLAAADSWWDPL